MGNFVVVFQCYKFTAAKVILMVIKAGLEAQGSCCWTACKQWGAIKLLKLPKCSTLCPSLPGEFQVAGGLWCCGKELSQEEGGADEGGGHLGDSEGDKHRHVVCREETSQMKAKGKTEMYRA